MQNLSTSRPEPRRSTRIRKLTARNKSIEHEGELEVTQPLKQRRKIKSKINVESASTKPKVGRLSKKRALNKLPDLPLDILFDIFGHAHPLDLLHLARTTKAFRGLLMRRSSMTIWVQAREILGVPQCPSDMSEPQYARLLFDSHCYFCDARTLTALWSCKIRCCKKCFADQFVDSSAVSVHMSSFGHGIHEPELLLPCAEDPHTRDLMFFNPHVQELVRAIDSMEGDPLKLQQLKLDRINLTETVKNHGKSLEVWNKLHNMNRSNKLNEFRIGRREAIKQKLKEHGFGVELDSMNTKDTDELMKQSWMNQPKELTERVWSNIKDSAIKYMTSIRDKMLAKERSSTLQERVLSIMVPLKSYLNTRPVEEYLPGVADFIFMPQFKPLLINAGHDEDFATLANNAFRAIQDDLPQICEDWRRSISERLLALLPSAGEENAASSDLTKLSLATTTFKCPNAGCFSDNIRYPRILVHRCLNRGSFDVHPTTLDADLLNALYLTAREAPWNIPNGLEFAHRASVVIGKLVELCGKDPEVTTVEEMDELDARFFCKRCAKLKAKVCAMTWQRVADHDACYHRGSPDAGNTNDWGLFNKSDTKLIKAKEDRACHGNPQPICQLCHCSHCDNMSFDCVQLLVDHLIDDHDIEEPDVDGIRMSLDVPVDLEGMPLIEIDRKALTTSVM